MSYLKLKFFDEDILVLKKLWFKTDKRLKKFYFNHFTLKHGKHFVGFLFNLKNEIIVSG